jgi:hypothetical protein
MDHRLKRVIDGHTHTDYNHVVEKAKFYRQISTGVLYGQIVNSFRTRETDAQEKQRINLTQKRTKSVIKKVIGYFDKVFRHEKIKFDVSHKDEAKKKEITALLPVYGNDGESLLEWVEQKSLFLNGLDPNAFYWIKKEVRNGKESFSPFIFYSKDVKDFSIHKGDVEYAICELSHSISYIETINNKDQPSKSKTIAIFYYFNDNKLTYAVELDKDIRDNTDFYTIFTGREATTTQKAIPIKNGLSEEKHNNKTYLVFTEDDGLKSSAISRIGYKLDPETNARTYVSVWDDASEECKILVNDGSVFDVSKMIHGFPKEIRYYTPCKYQDASSNSICRGGKLHPTGKDCPACHGTGKDMQHVSEQDVILIRIPTNDNPLTISPKDFIHYAPNPFQFMEMQKALVEEAPAKIVGAVFGVDISRQSTVATTATEVLNNFDTAQNALAQFTKAPSKMFKSTIKTFADYLHIDGVTAEIEYPNRYDLESEGQLLELLKMARDSQAPVEVLESLFKRLALKQNRAGDSSASVYEVMRKFMPFGGLDKELKQMVILSLPFSDLQRSLLLNFKEITEDIITNHNTFLMDDYEKQKKLVHELAQLFADASVSSNSVGGIADMAAQGESQEDN